MSQDSTKELSLSVDAVFTEAATLQKSKKNDESIVLYQKILDQSPSLTAEQASSVSHNLSLIYFEKNDLGHAYVFNQKALALNPSNKNAQLFHDQHGKLYSVISIPHEIPWYEQLNVVGLKYFSIEILALIFSAFLYFSLKKLFQFLVERKKAEVENTLPPRLHWSFYIYVFLGLFSFLGFYTKYYESQRTIGIITSDTAAIYTGPGSNHPVINDITLGNKVDILDLKKAQDEDFVQIRIPGAFSGWVSKSNIGLLNKTTWPASKTPENN